MFTGFAPGEELLPLGLILVLLYLLRKVIAWMVVIAVLLVGVWLLSTIASTTGRSEPDCMTRASTLAPGLSATAAAYRAEHSIARTRNIASASWCIDGRFGLDIAVSGRKSPAGSVPLPDQPQFRTFDPNGNGNTRELDSERKLLESINSRTSPTSTGILYLFSERQVCDSCQAVVEQFRSTRPLIRLSLG